MEGDDEALKKGDYELTKTAGAVDFIAYAKADSSTFHTITVVFMIMFVELNLIGGDYWLCHWAPQIGGVSDKLFVGVYGAFAIAFSIGAFARGYLFSRITTFKAIG
jgi:hypothetical protein